MTAIAPSQDLLQDELDRRGSRLRPPSLVMQPSMMGTARLTRYSFSRTMLRRAARDQWSARCSHFDIDEEGRGEAIYHLDADGRRFSFVAFTTTLDESEHTDRVIAERWEVTAALVEGHVESHVEKDAESDAERDASGELLALLRHEVPLQELGRFDPRVLVLTRGNRSVRFFDYLVSTLAGGEQPDPDLVADAGYILRSTAFYANGKYGMRSFEGYPDDHPLGVPYRAQLACAWMFRELGYDLVEHCARAENPDEATAFDSHWRRYFGLGNATGLGLVPYAFKHPRVMHAWVAIRELALADVRAQPGNSDRIDRLEAWIARAHRHFVHGTDDDCSPFLNAVDVAGVVARVQGAFEVCRGEPLPFDALYRWSENDGPETAELVVSLLIELHEADDDLIDKLLTVEEHASLDPTTTVGHMRELLMSRFGWLAEADVHDESSEDWWWVISDNTEEPRRTRRDRLEPAHRDIAIDVALRLWKLHSTLDDYEDETPIHRVLEERPEHRLAAERLVLSDRAYGEPRDNVCSGDYLPLMVQRFQLAMYGMDNFKPKSTDWLRVTLFQGAPRLGDSGAPTPGTTSDAMNDGTGDAMSDDWVLPPRPRKPECSGNANA